MKLKQLITGITIIITATLWITPAYAKLFFTNEVFWNEGEAFRIGQGDSATNTDLSLEFGSTGTETLGWDFDGAGPGDGQFEITDDFSMEGNQMKDVAIDNQSSAPGSPSAGEIYHNTTDDNTYVYNGSTWEAINTQTTVKTTAPVVQARRTASLTLSTTDWYDIPLTVATVDLETDTTILELNDSNSDRIDVKETGYYRITYHVAGNEPGAGEDDIEARVRVDDTTVLEGSLTDQINYNNEYTPTSGVFVAYITESGGSPETFITLQVRRTTADALIINDPAVGNQETTLTIEKMEKMQGATGSGAAGMTGTTSDSFTLDSDNSGGDITLQFGTALTESLKWSSATSEFILSDDLSVNGNISQNGTSFTLDADNTGVGADTDIVAEQGSDNNGTLRYNAAGNRWEISNDGGGFSAIDSGSGGGTLDIYYDYGGAGNGRTIDVDTGAVEITVSDTDNNAALILNQNDTTNNPNTLEITNTGTGYGLLAVSGDGMFDANLVAGGSTSRTETLSNTDFSLDGDDLFVAGDIGVEGDIFTDGTLVAGGLMLGNSAISHTGDLPFQADGDTDDAIHFSTVSNQKSIHFQDAGLGYTDDPGLGLTVSGEMAYRDEDEAGFTSFDSLVGGTPTMDSNYGAGHTITVDAGAIDLNGTGELLELGDGNGTDSYISFDDNDATDRQLGWDDSQTAISTFNQQFRFRTEQSGSMPPVGCSSTYSGMQWVDITTGVLYICSASESTPRNKWLSVNESTIYGEQNGTCADGTNIGNGADCSVNWGGGLGQDATTELGFYVPYPITITGYGFSEDNDDCAGTLDIEVWSTDDTSEDEEYKLEAEVATGLTGETGSSNSLNIDLTGGQYILWGIENSCGGGVDDFNVFLNYRQRKDVWLKYVEIQTVAAQIPGDLTDFPVYFDMSLLGDGHQFWTDYDYATDNDMIVTNSDGTVRYPLEIVDIDESGTPNTGQIHFKVDNLDGDAAQTFRIYYDNPDMTAQPDRTNSYGEEAVWSNNYVLVLHMEESGTSFNDETDYENDGTGVGTAQYTSGAMGNAQSFADDDSDYIRVPDDDSIGNSGMSTMTMSMWFDSLETGTYRHLAGTTNSYNGTGYNMYFRSATNAQYDFSSDNTYIRQGNVTSGWKYFVGTHTGTTMHAYVDGTELGTGTSESGGTGNNSADGLYIGRISGYTSRPWFYGRIDEVRVSNIDRSANWIQTEFNNQNNPGTFFTLP